jgi:tRNA threonylcarbamoyladenosine biosynthesis protein TsaE
MDTGHVVPATATFPAGVETTGPEGTAALGARASALLRGGEVLLLHGGLGAGKTCFVQGLCHGLGVTAEVVSPTFTLVNTYEGRLRVHHLDFYRIESSADLSDIGVPDLLDEVEDGGAVVVAEWPGPLAAALGSLPRLELLATAGGGPDVRCWQLRGQPEPAATWRSLFTGSDPAC